MALVDTERNAEALKALLQEPDDDPDDLEALDRAWAEEQVTFGPDKVGCPKAAAMVARMGETSSMNAVHQPFRVLTIALGAFGACWAAPDRRCGANAGLRAIGSLMPACATRAFRRMGSPTPTR